MQKEDYELLVRECCNRLPYGLMVVLNGIDTYEEAAEAAIKYCLTNLI